MARIPQNTLPIALAIITVGLTIAMLVGWPIVIVSSDEIYSTWLLVLGVISLSIILLALMTLIFFVARERRASRRQFGFIDSVTHELKSPLASMKLCLETLKRPDLPVDKGDGLIDMMLDDVDRLSAFISDVLQANRMLHGVALNRERVRIIELGEVVAARVARRYHVDPAQIRFEVAEGLAIWTDRLALETVLVNLLDNAIKYSDPPAEVTVTVLRPNSRRIRIDVQDKGIGMAREEQARVFERFYRVDAEDVRRRRGTGLGLYVVYALVRSMRGRVRAFSAGPGRGTTISVILPSRLPPSIPGASE